MSEQVTPPAPEPDVTESDRRVDAIVEQWEHEIDGAVDGAAEPEPEAPAEPEQKPEEEASEEASEPNGKDKTLDPRFAQLARKGAEARREQEAAKAEAARAEEAKSEAQRLLEEARAEREQAQREREEARQIEHRWKTDPLTAIKSTGLDPLQVYERLQRQAKDPDGFRQEQAKASELEQLKSVIEPLQQQIAELKAEREKEAEARAQQAQEQDAQKAREEFFGLIGREAEEKWPTLSAYYEAFGPESVMAYAAPTARAIVESGEAFTYELVATRIEEYLQRVRQLSGPAPKGETPPKPKPSTPERPRGPNTLTNAQGVPAVGPDPQSERAKRERLERLEEEFFSTLPE